MEKEELIEHMSLTIENELRRYLGYMTVSGVPAGEFLNELINSDELKQFILDFLLVKYNIHYKIPPDHINKLGYEIYERIKKSLSADTATLNKGLKNLDIRKNIHDIKREIWFTRRSMGLLERQLKNIANDIFSAKGVSEAEARRVRTMESAAAILLKIFVAREKSLMQELRELEIAAADRTNVVDLSLEEVDVCVPPLPLPDLELHES